MTLKAPVTLGNDNAAALLIQSAYRGYQARAEAEREAMTKDLERLEERGEAMVNSRASLMAKMKGTLGASALSNKLMRGVAKVTMANKLGGVSAVDRAPAGAEKDDDDDDDDGKYPLPSLSRNALEDILASLRKDNRFSIIDAMAILRAATVVFSKEASVVDVDAVEGGQVVVVGDLHGQLQDLLFILEDKGMPSELNKFVFNGDLVDRGNHGCEIALLLFALKIAFPKYIFVNRGNHEESFINIYSGFEEECLQKYDHKVFQQFQKCFDWLPYVSVVNKGVFVVHGGPPTDTNAKVQDIRTLPRGPETNRSNVDEKRKKWYKDMVWSDPHPEGSFIGVMPSHRGAGMLWGKNVTENFLTNNNLSIIIRSHQCVSGGIETCHKGKVFTVFSASRYCGTGQNKGAILVFGAGEVQPQPAKALVWNIPASANTVGYERISSTRKGKEAVNDAVAAQATEYIIEYKAELRAHWKAVEKAKKRAKDGIINLYEWAHGLTTVLGVSIQWPKVFDKLVKSEHIEIINGKRYVHWELFLSSYTVKLKGGCKEWQDDVVSRITSAVIQSGKDLLATFVEMDTDDNGTISKQEFVAALRKSIPSLNILSDSQIGAVWSSFDADGSGQVDFDEFKDTLEKVMNSDGGEHAQKVGVRWSTRTTQSDASNNTDAADGAMTPWEQTLSESFGRLLYSHRQELFHVWNTAFETDETQSIAKDDFKMLIRTLDASTGKNLLNEESLAKLADGMDLNGDGRIDFKEFCHNIGCMTNNY